MFAPDITVPLSEKTKPEYGMEVAQWIESMIIAGYGAPNGILGRKALNYSYAQGNQTYLASIKPVDNLSGNDFQTAPGADLQNLQLVPQLVSNLAGKMIKTKMKPSVTMIDSFSVNQRRDQMAVIELAMRVKQQKGDLEMLLQQTGLTEADIPNDAIELQLKSIMMPQFIEEMNAELALVDIAESSKFDSLRKQVAADLIINPGRSGYYIDRSLGRRQVKRLDPLNSGELNFSLYEDGRDVSGYYFLEPISISDIRFAAQGQISDEDLKRLTGGYFTQFYNGLYRWNSNGANWGGVINQGFINQVLVLHFEFVTTDPLYFSKKDGRPFPPTYQKRKNGKHGDVEEIQVQNLISGSYICGYGNMLYDYGIVENAIRQPQITGKRYINNPALTPEEIEQYTMQDAKKVFANRVYGNFITYQPDMVQGITKSAIDRVRPLIDTFNQTWHKFVDAMGMYIPYFLWVDNSAIAEITMRENGEELSAEDMVATAIKRGWLLGDSAEMRGSHIQTFKDAIQLTTSSGEPLSVLWNLLIQQDRYVRDAFGLPLAASGIQGNGERPGKAVTEMLLQGGDDNFTGIAFAEIQLIQNLNEVLLWDIMQNGDDGVVNGRQYSVPPGNPNENIPKLKVEVLPEQAKWDQLIAYANESKAQGLVTDADIFMLETIDNLKQAQAYLSVVTKRAQERIAREKMDAIRATGEEQRASNAQTHNNQLQLEMEKAAGEQKRELIVAYGKLSDTFLNAAMKLPKEGESPLNIEKANAILQKLTDELKELYGAVTATSPGVSTGASEPATTGDQPVAA